MAVKCEYKCSNCSHDYVEIRDDGTEPFFTNCNRSCGGTYVLVQETHFEPELPPEIIAAQAEPAAITE